MEPETAQDERESRFQGVEVTVPMAPDGERTLKYRDATDWETHDDRLLLYGPGSIGATRTVLAEFPKNGWTRVVRLKNEKVDDSMISEAARVYSPNLNVHDYGVFEAGWKARDRA